MRKIRQILCVYVCVYVCVCVCVCVCCVRARVYVCLCVREKEEPLCVHVCEGHAGRLLPLLLLLLVVPNAGAHWAAERSVL